MIYLSKREVEYLVSLGANLRQPIYDGSVEIISHEEGERLACGQLAPKLNDAMHRRLMGCLSQGTTPAM